METNERSEVRNVRHNDALGMVDRREILCFQDTMQKRLCNVCVAVFTPLQITRESG
jgi:hypothetical protein